MNDDSVTHYISRRDVYKEFIAFLAKEPYQCRDVNKELIAFLAKEPYQMQKLHFRQFETLIAELLAGFGWQVNLTSPTRDGGYDILGVCRDAPGLFSSWVVECKKYSPQTPIRARIVYSLYNVKQELGVSNGLLVTTSRYSAGAKQYVENRRDLHLVDFEVLCDWLAGYKPPQTEQAYLPASTFASCFVSYSHKDKLFAEFLCKRLRECGVGVWFAPEDVLPGEKLHHQIGRAIRTFDRLLIVLSEASMKSKWVKTELKVARRREVEEEEKVLFPIGLAPFERISKWTCFDAYTGTDVAAELCEYPVPDFSNWKDQGVFDTQFKKLLLGLSVK